MNNLKEARRSAKERVREGLGKRYRAERRFQFYGKLAIGMGTLFLAMLFISIVGNGLPAFQQSYMELEVTLDPNIWIRKGIVPRNLSLPVTSVV